MGETGGETEEKIQKIKTEHEKYKGERELERKIVEIHRGEIYVEKREKGEKKEIDSSERHRSIDRGKETQEKRQREEIERRVRVER